MNFPTTVYHRDFGPRQVNSSEDLVELELRYGRGWNTDPVAAAQGPADPVEIKIEPPIVQMRDHSKAERPGADRAAVIEALGGPATISDERLAGLAQLAGPADAEVASSGEEDKD